MEKSSSGYGFHLHGEKGKTGQFIRQVEADTPAYSAGLRAGDRLAFVNGESVEGESHAQVVSRIKATVGTLELIVVDQETLELLKRYELKCRKEYVTEGIPLPASELQEAVEEEEEDEEVEERANGSRRGSSPVEENGERGGSRRSSVNEEERSGPRPRLCLLQKGPGGYGFNLHSDKSRPGQFIRAVDNDSAAQRAGLLPNDKIVQVNGVSVMGKLHSEVVASIKASGDEVSLLVVDAEADDFFTSCNVLPTEEHLTGPLPELPVRRVSVEEQPEIVEERAAKTSVGSNNSRTSQPSPVAMTTQEEPESDSLGLGLSVAQARERAHQKRSAKNAPRMDWNKRNEVFSNL